MITVIVDTTATFVDVTMRSTAWMQLLTLCHNSQVQVVLPDVVLRETARHWEVEALAAISTANGKVGGIRKSREKLTELGIEADGLVELAQVTATPDRAKYEKGRLEELVSLGVQVKPVPDHVDVEVVLERDLAGKKPFSKNGKGFRDTLIWETTKHVALDSEAGDVIFLVTENSNDFCDASGSLAPELIAELEDVVGEVIRVPNLEELLSHGSIASMVAGLAKTDEELAEFLRLATGVRGADTEPPQVDQVVKDAVLSALDRLVGEAVETVNEATYGLDFTSLVVPAEIEDLSIDTIDPDESTLSWQTYATYQDTTLLIQAEINAEISLLGFAHKSDVGHGDEEVIHVLEWDWNDHYSYVSATTVARLTFQVRLERGMQFADECEFEGAQPLVDETPRP